jgi:ADP-heptose:LPS heptosyltransferase
MLPDLQDIEEQCVNHIEFDGIFVDHQEKQRSILYFKETDFKQVPDDLLEKCLDHFDYCPDFILLDSAGHMGNIEFHYVIDKLKKPCIIALDDIYHIKHHKSYLQMKKDPRFTFIAVSKEKFGFCVAEFTPETQNLQRTAPVTDQEIIDKSFLAAMGDTQQHIVDMKVEKMFLDDLMSMTYLSEDPSDWKPEPVVRSRQYKELKGDRPVCAEKDGRKQDDPAGLGPLMEKIRQYGYPYRHQYIVVYADQPYIRHGQHWAAILRQFYGNIEVPVVRVLFKPGFDQWRIVPRHETQPVSIAAEETRNILFVRLDAIGDTVLAASTLPHLKSRFPQARICVLCQKHVAEIYEAIAQVDDVMAIDKMRAYRDENHLAGIVSQLQHQAFDLALHTTWSREPIGDYLTISSKARRTVGFLGDHCNLPAPVMEKHNAFYSHLIPSPGRHQHELVRLRDFLSGLGNPCDDPCYNLGDNLVPEFPLTPGDNEFAKEFFENNRLDPRKTIILIAGALTANRHYDAYGSALNPICRDSSFSVVALGSQKDWKLSQSNLDAVSGRTFNLCGRSSIRQAAALIRSSRLVVGAETGLAHIACAVGTPNVVLLGGGHFGRFMPYTPLTTVACMPLDCYYCNWHCKHTKPHCVYDIQPKVIRTAVLESLAAPADVIRIFTQDASLHQFGTNGPAWEFPDHLIHWDNVKIHPVNGTNGQHRPDAQLPMKSSNMV